MCSVGAHGLWAECHKRGGEIKSCGGMFWYFHWIRKIETNTRCVYMHSSISVLSLILVLILFGI